MDKGRRAKSRNKHRKSGRKPTYGPDDLSQLSYEADLGDAGTFPYTRGIYRDMYRSRLWTMRQYAGYGTARESNKRYRFLLSQGTTGLSVAFDLPTQIGLDSDHHTAKGEVGRVGVAIDSLQDMEELFEGIPLDEVSTSMTINATAPILLALYLLVAKKQQVPWSKLRGTVQNDILKEYIARGTYIYPPDASMRLVTDVFQYCGKNVPKWKTISVSGYHIREAGATAIQELAFTLANAEAYISAALASGLKIDDVAPQVSFFFSSDRDFLEEVAKFRAARKLWATRLKAKFGATDSSSLKLRFHTQTAGSSLTASQPDNNVVRVTLQALAAVLGGTQSLHTNSKDEALALPTEEAAQLAVRTQQIIAHESGVASVVDPLGGSWCIEALTLEIFEGVISYLERIEELGGVVSAIERGFFQREIQASAYEYQKGLEAQEISVLGVNLYCDDHASAIETLKVDQELELEQVNKLKVIRARRDAGLVQEGLKRVREAAQGEENLMPAIIDAAAVHATVGEISSVLREVFGEYREHVLI